MPEHKNIPDDGLHEPKGVVAATSGQVYVANGAGSGVWSIPEPKGIAATPAGQTYYSNGAGSGQWLYPPQGWGVYVDSVGVTQVIDTTPTTLTINGLGVATDESYLPREIRGTASLWDGADNLITPVAEGDAMDLRIDFTVTSASGLPKYLLFQLDIGPPGTPIIAVEREVQFDRTATPFSISFGFSIYALDTFMANGGRLVLSTDAGTVTLGARRIHISRNFGERP